MLDQSQSSRPSECVTLSNLELKPSGELEPGVWGSAARIHETVGTDPTWFHHIATKMACSVPHCLYDSTVARCVGNTYLLQTIMVSTSDSVWAISYCWEAWYLSLTRPRDGGACTYCLSAGLRVHTLLCCNKVPSPLCGIATT